MRRDLLLHAVAWALLSGSTAALAVALGWPQPWLLALLFGVMTAGLWELYQKETGRGFAQWSDFLTGSASSALVALATYVNT